MKKLHAWKIMVLAAMMIMAYASVAFAGAQDFTLVNRTGHTIYHVYVSPVNSSEWEEDILSSGVLMDGESTKITFDSYNDRYWDLKVVFSDGSDLYWETIDLKSTYTITLNRDGTATLD